jgi:NAD(P)-dependent dehydrogenase (short-subunit alcohol dehydrogenase family)
MQFTGKNAVITGGTTGIGLATAVLLARAGARVAITGQDASRIASAKKTIGDGTLGYVANAAVPDESARLREKLSVDMGRIDILFANAGVAYPTALGQTSEDVYDSLMDINTKGVFFTVQNLLPLLNDGASVVLNTSWLADVGTPGLAVLSASKAAVRSFARTMAAELRDRAIRVNAVSPGAMATPIHSKTGMNPEQLQAFSQTLVAKIPLGRMGTADDVAQAVLFLASTNSSYMLGAEIAVDGGFAQI